MKRIIICCDGTWNSPDASMDGVPCPTNVAKIARAVLPAHEGVRQLTYYNSGVGATGGWLYRRIAGATGLGLSENLLHAYEFLIRTYVPGDELYLFGFSRGAFTVRSLAGLINNCGILRPVHGGLVSRAFDIYRSRTAASHPRQEEATLFRKTYAHMDKTPLRFLGVWDTVGALGNPLLMMRGPLSRRHRFHDTCLSSTVEHACHALAIDEKRRHFKATLWRKQPTSLNQHLEQRWFVGVHANVGGGYVASGLSDLALKWMAGEARSCDLGLNDEGLISPDTRIVLKESRRGLYLLIPPYHRPITYSESRKPIESVNRNSDRWETCESIDESVVTYLHRHPGYRPPALENWIAANGEQEPAV